MNISYFFPFFSFFFSEGNSISGTSSHDMLEIDSCFANQINCRRRRRRRSHKDRREENQMTYLILCLPVIHSNLN